MRKVFVKVTVSLTINIDEGVEVGDVINDLDYNFISQTPGADIEDTQFADYEVTYSK